jgi:hypothetical protein
MVQGTVDAAIGVITGRVKVASGEAGERVEAVDAARLPHVPELVAPHQHPVIGRREDGIVAGAPVAEEWGNDRQTWSCPATKQTLNTLQ